MPHKVLKLILLTTYWYHLHIFALLPEFRKAMAPVHLPLSCYKVPKEAFPPSPECWRVHPSRPNATPCLHLDKKPDLFTHWRTLNEQRKERESKSLFWKRRNFPRCALPISVFFTPSQLLQEKRGESGWVGMEWDKSSAREDPAILDGQLHQVGISL